MHCKAIGNKQGRQRKATLGARTLIDIPALRWTNMIQHPRLQGADIHYACTASAFLWRELTPALILPDGRRCRSWLKKCRQSLTPLADQASHKGKR